MRYLVKTFISRIRRRIYISRHKIRVTFNTTFANTFGPNSVAKHRTYYGKLYVSLNLLWSDEQDAMYWFWTVFGSKVDFSTLVYNNNKCFCIGHLKMIKMAAMQEKNSNNSCFCGVYRIKYPKNIKSVCSKNYVKSTQHHPHTLHIGWVSHKNTPKLWAITFEWIIQIQILYFCTS